MQNYSIRILTNIDIKAVTALHKASFEKSWPESEMRGHIQNDRALGCFTNDTIDEALIGFILVRQVYDQAEILTLAVSEPYRRAGIARALLKQLETDVLKGTVKALFLEVAEDNPAAIKLYKSQGFEAIGRRPGYYRRKDGRVAALNFAKRL